jgi:hypothetical protein
VHGVDVIDGDPDLSPSRVLPRLGLGEVEQHVVPRGEVSPSHVIMHGLISSVLMRLVIEFEPEELSVELR